MFADSRPQATITSHMQERRRSREQKVGNGKLANMSLVLQDNAPRIRCRKCACACVYICTEQVRRQAESGWHNPLPDLHAIFVH